MDIFIRSILVSIFLLSLSCNPQNTAENDINYSIIENENIHEFDWSLAPVLESKVKL